MKRTLATLAATLALTAGGVATAQDHDGRPEGAGSEPEPPPTAVTGSTSGRLGIGFSETLAGVRGLEVELVVGNRLMITGLLSFEYQSPDGFDANNSSVTTFAGGVFYKLATGDRAALLVGGRLAMGLAQGNPRSGDRQYNLEVPARVQVWLSEMISIHLETGLMMAFTDDDGGVIPPVATGFLPDGTVIRLGANLFGAGGVTVYVR